MRLGLVIYGDLQTHTGGYLYDRQLVDHLRRSGDNVEIVSLPWRSYAAHLADNLSSTLSRRLLDLDVDLLLEDELNHPSLLRANQRLAQSARVAIVSIVHHLRSSEPWPAALRVLYRTIERRYLKGADAFVFNSHATRASVERLIGAGRPAVVAPPGGDRLRGAITLDDVRARAESPGPLRVLFVGSLTPRKGLHVLLEALAALPTGTWRLEIVGDAGRDTGYAARIRRLITRLSLQGSVHLLGPTDDAGLAQAYRRNQVLAVPSAYEGFGIAYLEAMDFGLPVLASAAGGAIEIVTDGETGHLIPPGRPDVLAQHLRRLSQDRRLLARLGSAAQQTAHTRPGWDHSMEDIRRFLVRLSPTGAAAPALSLSLGGTR